MKFLIRVDGNKEIGLGHVMSSLQFAKGITEKLECELFVLTKDEMAANIFKKNIHTVGVVIIDNEIEDIKKIKPDVIFTDLLEVDKDYIDKLKSLCSYVVCRDSLIKDKDIAPNLLINRNLVSRWIEYNKQENTIYLLGPQYELLDKAFQEYHNKEKITNKEIKKILIAFGSSGESKLYKDLSAELRDYEIVMVSSKVTTNEVPKILHNISRDNFAKLLHDCDIIICSSSKICYEAACVGTPALLISFNDHQAETGTVFSKEGYAIYLGKDSDLSISYIRSTIEKMNKSIRENMSSKQKSLLDGAGFERIYTTLHKDLKSKGLV